MRHVIVWTRIGAVVLAAIAVLTVTQKTESESKASEGSIGNEPIDAHHSVALGTGQTAVTQDPHALHGSDEIFRGGAMRARWVLRDSRVSFAADDLYSSENDLMSGRAVIDPSITRTSMRETIIAGSSSGVESPAPRMRTLLRQMSLNRKRLTRQGPLTWIRRSRTKYKDD